MDKIDKYQRYRIEILKTILYRPLLNMILKNFSPNKPFKANGLFLTL